MIVSAFLVNRDSFVLLFVCCEKCMRAILVASLVHVVATSDLWQINIPRALVTSLVLCWGGMPLPCCACILCCVAAGVSVVNDVPQLFNRASVDGSNNGGIRVAYLSYRHLRC